MAYARALIDTQRYAGCGRADRSVTSQQPEFARGVAAARHAAKRRRNQLDAAQTSLKRFLALAKTNRTTAKSAAAAARRPILSLAQIAEKRKDYAAANAWLDKHRGRRRPDGGAEPPRVAAGAPGQAGGSAQAAPRAARAHRRRRAHEADGRSAAAARQQAVPGAYDLLAPRPRARTRTTHRPAVRPGHAGREARPTSTRWSGCCARSIAAKPDYHHAYNALGYSLADRNLRLRRSAQADPEGAGLAPGDPFISDSLGWVEFRMGNKGEAAAHPGDAYKEQARRGDRRPPGRSALEHGPARRAR